MAISSSISNDLSNKTSTLIIKSGITTIENIVYTYSSNSLYFSTIPTFSISANDFIYFSNILDNFTKTIQDTFKSLYSISSNFSISQISDMNDGISILNFIFQKANHPIYNITATYPSGNISFAFRNQSTTLSYDEYVFFHLVSAHFQDEIIKFYKL